ncbi:hypothetical protein IKN40_00030 [bacterium]|nr:hypothetical protein [bacterium]
MKFNKQTIYIALFAILYLIVAFSSFWHACAFFGLANNSWMSIILAFAFEIGQAAVLFSLLTSKKDRSRVMPWILMIMFTLVQVIGNVYSSYKYIINNSVENLRYFKEPIFIWTDLPDDQATVIIVYIVGAILPICALLLTSMITNYLSDKEEELRQLENNTKIGNIDNEIGPKEPIILNSEEDFDKVYKEEAINNKNEFNEDNNDSLINQNSILQMEKQGLQEQVDKLKEDLKNQENTFNEEIKKENDLLKEQLNQNEENSKKEIAKINNERNAYINAFEESDKENKELKEELIKLQDKLLELENERKQEDESNNNDGSEQQLDRTESEANASMGNNSIEENSKGISESIKSIDKNIQLADALMGGNILQEKSKKPSHFIN